MILGRNPALIVGLVAALLNVLVIVFGVPLTTEGLAALNGLAVAFVAVLANEADPTTLGTFALAIRTPAQKAASLSTVTASSPGDQAIPTAGTSDAPTTDPTAGGAAGGAGGS